MGQIIRCLRKSTGRTGSSDTKYETTVGANLRQKDSESAEASRERNDIAEILASWFPHTELVRKVHEFIIHNLFSTRWLNNIL